MNKVEQRIKNEEALRLRSSQLADLYLHVIKLSEGTGVSVEVHFFAHGVREFANTFARQVAQAAGKDVKRAFQADEDLKTLVGAWDGQAETLNEKGKESLATLIQKYKDYQARPSNSSTLHHVLTDDTVLIPATDAVNTATENWDELTQWFVIRAHVTDLPSYQPEDWQECIKKWELLEDALYGLLFPPIDSADSLEELVKAANKDPFTPPNSSQQDKFKALLRRPQHFELFFKNLRNPRWFPFLIAQGLFNSTSPLISTAEGIITPAHLPLTYVIKIADQLSGEELNSVITSPIRNTDNPRVMGDLLDCIQKLPPQYLNRDIAQLVSKWVRSDFAHYRLLVEKAGLLVIRFTEKRSYREAQAIVSNILRLNTPPTPPDYDPENIEYYFKLEAKPAIGDWQYQEYLEGNFKPFMQARPLMAGTVLIKRLREFMDAKKRGAHPEDLETWEDFSSISRVRINDSERDHNVNDLLINSLVELIHAVKANQRQAEGLLDILLRERWLIFKRLAMFLLTNLDYSFNNNLILEKIFNDPSLINGHGIGIEFDAFKEKHANLITDQFVKLYEKAIIDAVGGLKTLDEYEPHQQNYILTRLRTFADKLILSKNLYNELLNKYGEKHAQEAIIMGNGGAEFTPKKPKPMDLDSYTPEELAKYLATTEASNDPFGFHTDELSEGLTRLFRDNPTHYLASGFIKNLPTGHYPAILTGLKENTQKFGDEVVENTLNWLLQLTDEITGKEDRITSAILYKVIDLMEAALGMFETLGESSRKKLWELITKILASADPEEVHIREIEEGSSNNDFDFLALNSVVGKAAYGAVNYALQLKNHLGKDYKESLLVTIRPEIGLQLKSLASSPSATALTRSVIASHLPHLNYIDPTWYTQNLEYIFPLSGTSKERAEAWASYLRQGRLDQSLYPSLEQHFLFYSQHPEDLRDVTGVHGFNVGIVVRHAEFLVLGFMLNLSPLEWFMELFSKSTEAERKEIIVQIGMMFKDYNFASGQIDKLRHIHELLLNEYPKSPSMVALGDWFVRIAFDEELKLDLILAAAKITGGKLEHFSLILNGLEKLVDNFPEKTIELLSLITPTMMKEDSGAWHVNDVYQLLERAVNHSISENMQVNINLIASEMFSANHHEFISFYKK